MGKHDTVLYLPFSCHKGYVKSISVWTFWIRMLDTVTTDLISTIHTIFNILYLWMMYSLCKNWQFCLACENSIVYPLIHLQTITQIIITTLSVKSNLYWLLDTVNDNFRNSDHWPDIYPSYMYMIWHPVPVIDVQIVFLQNLTILPGLWMQHCLPLDPSAKFKANHSNKSKLVLNAKKTLWCHLWPSLVLNIQKI